MTNLKLFIDADVISLTEIGRTESRNDIQIKKYVKTFVQNNYEKEIDDDLALIIVWIIDDLLSDMEKTKMSKKEFWMNAAHTRGYAACDKCKGGEMVGSTTYQNGKITLCQAHYNELED